MSGRTYTEEINDIHQVMEGLKKGIENLTNEVSAIKQALLGSEFGDTGMVKRVQEAENEIQQLKTFKQKLTWIAVGISFGTGGVASMIIQWVMQ